MAFLREEENSKPEEPISEENGLNKENGGKISSDLLRGHTDTIILQLLSKKDCYGYEVRKAIAEKTGERYELKEATLYASFKRLENDGAITSYWGDETQGGRRRYYCVTAKGLKLLRENKIDWKFTAKIISSLLEEEYV